MDTLTTPRLTLRPFRPEDADDVLAYATEPGWSEYLVNVPSPFTRADAESFITRFSDPASWDDVPMFAIVIDGRAVGEVYIDALDRANERAAVGYSLDPAYWGKGYATEAVTAVMDWAFRTYGLHRLYATCDPRNHRSMRVLEKLGMKREGLLTHHLKWNGEYRDVAYYGILREQWEAQQGGRLHEQQVRR